MSKIDWTSNPANSSAQTNIMPEAAHYEPYRDCRRLQNLRDWSYDKSEVQKVFARNKSTRRSTLERVGCGLFIRMGSDEVDCRKDRLQCRNTTHLGATGRV